MYPRLNQQIRKQRNVATKRIIRVIESTQTPIPRTFDPEVSV